VCVVGAGIGGLAIARGLHAHRHDVVVVEEADALRGSGATVQIWFNGMAALGELGVTLEGVSQRIDVLEGRSSDGSVRSKVDVARLARRFGVPAVTIARRRLLERLAEALPHEALLFDRACRSVSQDRHNATVELDDGKTLRADLVVGADGHRSVVRAAVVGDGSAKPNGWAAWQGMTAMPLPEVSASRSLYIIGKGAICGLMPAPEGQLHWWFEFRWPPGVRRPPSVVTMLKERFGSWASPVPQVLGAISETEVELWPYIHHRVPRVFGKGRIVLLGDALHAMPPTMAQGANQALEDAWVLTRAVATTRDPATALRQYQHARRWRIALVSNMSKLSPIHRVSSYWPRLTVPPSGLATPAWGCLIRSISNTLS
jgi:FAD-dependent urate hydroxylase